MNTKGKCAMAVAVASLTLTGCALPLLGLAASGGTLAGGLALNKSMSGSMVKKNAQANAPRVTAIAIGQNLTPQDVRVSQIKANMQTVSWLADTKVGRYSCSSSSNLMDTLCSKR